MPSTSKKSDDVMELSGAETPVRCAERDEARLLAILSLVAALLAPCLCFSDLFRALFLFLYGPFCLFAVLCLVIAFQAGISSALFPPAVACLLLSPFATWHSIVIPGSLNIVISVILFNAAVFWLLLAISSRIESCSAGSSWLVGIARANTRFLIYTGIIPTCVGYLLGFFFTNGQSVLANTLIANSWFNGPLPELLRVRLLLLCISPALSTLMSFALIRKSRGKQCQLS